MIEATIRRIDIAGILFEERNAAQRFLPAMNAVVRARTPWGTRRATPVYCRSLHIAENLLVMTGEHYPIEWCAGDVVYFDEQEM